VDKVKNKIFLPFLLLVLAGSFLRFYQLSHQSYWMDEGYTINAVLSINEKGTPILDSGQTYSCPTYCYPTALVTHLFGEKTFSYRFLSAVFGVLFIVVIFYIARKLFSEKIAFLSSFFISFSYWQIAWSRQARWYTLFTVFFWLALYFFYQTLCSAKNNSVRRTEVTPLSETFEKATENPIFRRTHANKTTAIYFLLTVLFTTLAILTHGLGYLLPFIFFAWFLTDELFIKKTFAWKKIALGAIALFAGIFTIANIFHVEIFTALISKISFHYELPYYLSFYLREYWFFIVFSFFALSITDSKYKKEMRYLAFVFLFYLFPLSFFTGIVHYRYLFHVTPIFFILASVAIVSIAESSFHGRNFLSRVVLKEERSDGERTTLDKKWFLPFFVRNVFTHRKMLCFFAMIAATFFTVGGGVIVPRNTYYLESDNPETLGPRPYYAYTPQPEWNAAYEYIKNNKQKTDLVISSHPQFTKIFLNQPGYWLQYNYLGITDEPNTVKDSKEYYVGAQVVANLSELESLIKNNHGYIIFDYMAIDGKIPKAITEYIQKSTKQLFHQKTSVFSQVWVYEF
jgi:4-amino-4-deoxy-L-arabinose transferase-like glycosyltransferase